MSAGLHWATQYLGHGWASGAQGPDCWDCWSFFRHVQSTHYGVDVPIVGVDADRLHTVTRAFTRHAERARWVEVDTPLDGDAVLMAHGRYPSHVGVWIDADGGGVLHCQNGAGVLFTSRGQLASMGWARASYFRMQAA